MSKYQFKVIVFVVVALGLASCGHDGVIVQVEPKNPEVVRASGQSVLSEAIDSAFDTLDLKTLTDQVATIQKSMSEGTQEKEKVNDIAKQINDALIAKLEQKLGSVGRSISAETAEALKDALYENRRKDADELESILLKEMDQKLSSIYTQFGQEVTDSLKRDLIDVIEPFSRLLKKQQGHFSQLSVDEVTAYIQVVSTVDLPQSTLHYIRQKAAVAAGVAGVQLLEVREKYVPPYKGATSDPAVEVIYPDTHAKVVMLVSYAGVDQDLTKLRQRSHGSAEPDQIFVGKFKGTFSIVPRMTSFPGYTQEIRGESLYPITRGKFVVLKDER